MATSASSSRSSARFSPGGAEVAERWRKRITGAITVLAPLLLVAIGYLLVDQLNRAESLRQAETQSHERRSLVLSILSAHQDIETGQRGYLLTGNEKFLDPYVKASRDMERVRAELRGAYAGDHAGLDLLDRIAAASSAKRAFVDRTIALLRAGDGPGAVTLVNGGSGKDLMDDLRLEIDRLERLELSRLQSARQSAADGAIRMRVVILLLVGLLLVLLSATIVATVRLLQARTTALYELEDLSQRQGAILDSAMDTILTLNPSGSVESINAAGLRMFGYDDAEALRRDVGMLFATPPAIGTVAEQLRAMALTPGRPGTLQEIIGRRKDRTTFPADVAITAMPRMGAHHYVAVVRDVSERQRIARMKSEFVSTVSHELRTPLTSIAGSLGLLAGGAAGELDERARRLIEIARNNAARLVRLINDILDIDKIESGKMRFANEPLDLDAAIAAAIDANQGMAGKYGVELSYAQGTAAPVMADPDRLEQVLTNLLSNALKFSPPGGVVEIALQPGPTRHRISVIDQGPGIPEEFRGRMFEKFAQADSSDARQLGGTGLGLSIVREIVERLGGTVSFDCPPTGGTRFHVDLPALSAEAPPLPAAERVLLCGAEIAGLLRPRLEKIGLAVAVAGETAAASTAVANEAFAAIVVDLTAAGGAGIAVVRAARGSALNAATPVLVVGGEAQGDVLAGDGVALVDWIAGPNSAQDLVSAISQAISGARNALPLVLHVDDDPDVLKIVAGALDRRAALTSVATLREAREQLARTRFDLVILDLTLNDGQGAELLTELNSPGAAGPAIIIFSAEDAQSAAAGVVSAFLTKSRTPLPELVAWVERLARGQLRGDR